MPSMLPPRPAFLPARPEGALAPAEPPASLVPLYDPLPQAGPSSTSATGSGTTHSTTCLICSQPAKYTCPRCSTRTCSVPCSKLHKEQLDCDGKRDPSKFVTLNTFSQGDWGGDYAYLESGRRRVADWGKDLPPSHSHSQQTTHRGGGGGGGRRGKGSPKVEGLRRELEKRGIEVEFMAEGMGRRKMNQSSWNPKTQSLHLTIQLSIPSKLLETESRSESESTNLSISPSPKIITHLRVLFVSPNPAQHAPSLSSLLPESLRQPITLVLPFHPSLANPTPVDILLRKPRPKLFFPPLAADRPISEDVLKGMSWVEFPIIHVWSTSDWESALEAGLVAVVPVAVATQGGGHKRKAEAALPEAEAGAGDEPRPSKVVSTGTTGGLSVLDVYDSEEDDAVENAIEVEDDDITEADVQVLHALGAAAAADME